MLFDVHTTKYVDGQGRGRKELCLVFDHSQDVYTIIKIIEDAFPKGLWYLGCYNGYENALVFPQLE